MQQTTLKKEVTDIVNSIQPIDLLYPDKKNIPFIYRYLIDILRAIILITILFQISILYISAKPVTLESINYTVIFTPIFTALPVIAFLILQIRRSLNKQLRAMQLPLLTLTMTIHEILPLKVLQRKKIREALVNSDFLENINDLKRMNNLVNNLAQSEQLRIATRPISTFRIYLPVILIWFLSSLLEPLLVDTGLVINSDFWNNILSSIIFLIISITLIMVSEGAYQIQNKFIESKNDQSYGALQKLIDIRMEMEKEEVKRIKNKAIIKKATNQEDTINQ